MEEVEDPHELAFPSAHFARQSVVDNLVMSLDRVSPTASHEYARANARKPRHQNQSDRSRAQRDPLATIFGDDEDSHRAKAYGAQRAAQVPRSKTQERSGARSRSSSNSSSVDLGHLATFTGRLGPAGNRRSQSFDFGSRRPARPLLDAAEIAPSPRTIAGAANEISTTSSPPTVVQRRNSGRSAKTATRTKRRSGTVGASSVRPKNDSPQALPPIGSFMYETVERKLPPTPTPEATAPTARPGFFKRVFGSARTTPTASSSGTSTPVPQLAPERSGSIIDSPRPSTPLGRPVKQAVKTAADSVSNKENLPVVTKKPSSFFRRRKKSISSSVPAPLPLTLNSLQSEQATDAPSPVSSLKALMDPYLATDVEKRYRHTRGGSIHSITNVTPKQSVQRNLDAETPQMLSKHGRHPSAKSLTKLEIPAKSPTMSKSTLDDMPRKTEKAVLSQHSSKLATNDRGLSPVLATPSTTSREQRSPRKSIDPAKSATLDRTTSATSGGPPSPSRRQTNHSFTSDKAPLSVADSDVSVYRSAPSTPIVQDLPHKPIPKSPHVHVSQPSLSQMPDFADVDKARRIYQNPEDELVGNSTACAWLGDGDPDREGVRNAYMEIFDWSTKTILDSLRSLCSKMVLKGETQQVDRIIGAFAQRWCVCNSNNGFKSSDVVHTICYSILLLNTDLHLADIGQKMTITQFIRNAMVPIREVATDAEQAINPQVNQFLAVRTNSYQGSNASTAPSSEGQGRSASALSSRISDRVSRDEPREGPTGPRVYHPLVEAPYIGSQGGWELQLESILKDFYSSILRDPLPLFGQIGKLAVPSSGASVAGLSTLRRSPSILSKAQSENRSRPNLESKSLGARWARKTASRVRLGPGQPYGSSRTSLDDGSSNWSPLSSTWSRVSLGKTLTSMSVDSFATEHTQADYQSSIGFANALSQAIIRDEQLDLHSDEGLKATPLLEDESLELQGAPWAKEGMLKHKCHLEGVGKRSRDRNWTDCFAVIEKGWMRLFSFSTNAKSVRNKDRNQKMGGVVGGGNWQDNAEEVWKFMLRHTIASTLPPPGYSKLRPFVWALSLPNGAVHLFSVGTPDIVKEFVSTANFWSARLSKEPIAPAVGSMEFGWSDNVINRALVPSESLAALGPSSPRPSTQLSLRSSIDHVGVRPRLPGDKAHISEWSPPQQSLTPSQLMEVDQQKALQNYVKNVEEELQKHNELRSAMLMAFSSRHPNTQKAMTNWEKKSSYLLHEIVKFSTYIEALNNSQKCKDKVYKMREEDQAAREADRAAAAAELAVV